MHIAFGRVRHKTSPTRGGENVCLFFWFTIVISCRLSVMIYEKLQITGNF